jgi:integrase
VSIHKLTSGRYQARIRIEGQAKKMTFDRKRDAEDWEKVTLADARRGKYVDTLNKTTVAEYFEHWISIRPVRAGTLRNYNTMLVHYIQAYPLGVMPLVRVRHSDVQSWVSTLAQRLHPYTVQLRTELLKSMFTSAVHDGLAASNPVNLKLLAMPPVERYEVVPLTVPQVRAWADAVPPWARGAVIAQAGLGLRMGELRALRIADINFLKREVRVAEQLNRRGDRAPLKNSRRKPVRILPLPVIVAEAIAEQIRRWPNPVPGGPVFWGNPYSNPAYKARIATLVGTWDQRRYAGVLRKAAVAAGLGEHHKHRAEIWKPNTEAEGFARHGRRGAEPSSHDLRHHFVSVMLGRGATIHEVAELIGDKPEAVLKTYGHVMPDRSDITRRHIDDAWAETAAGNTGQETGS